MILLILGFVLYLLSEQFFFTPFIILIYFFFFDKKKLFLSIILFGFISDFIFVFRLGFSSSIFFLFVLGLWFYQIKYNSVNQKFLFLVLGVAFYFWGKIVGTSFSYWQIFFFSLCYFWLSLKLKQKREEALKIG